MAPELKHNNINGTNHIVHIVYNIFSLYISFIYIESLYVLHSVSMFHIITIHLTALSKFHWECLAGLAHISGRFTQCYKWTKFMSHVLMVRYCGLVGCPSSDVVRRASCVVRRPSCVNIWCLHSRDHVCDTIFMKLCQNVCFDNI